MAEVEGLSLDQGAGSTDQCSSLQQPPTHASCSAAASHVCYVQPNSQAFRAHSSMDMCRTSHATDFHHHPHNSLAKPRSVCLGSWVRVGSVNWVTFCATRSIQFDLHMTDTHADGNISLASQASSHHASARSTRTNPELLCVKVFSRASSRLVVAGEGAPKAHETDV